MESNKPILELNQIQKGFRNNNGNLRVLQDVSFQVYPGEIVALIGPSGCGKTTLLNIVAGLTAPDRGGLEKPAGLRLAFAFQEPRLLPWKTVEDNIRFVQGNFLQPAEAEEIRETLLCGAGLAKYKNSYPAELSGGMKQRLEIVRALSVKPDLLLMDEPFKSLDIALKHRLTYLTLAEHGREGFAVLFITHDPEEAVMLADRVLVFSDKPAKICQEITVDQPRQERNIKDDSIYKKVEELLAYLLKDLKQIPRSNPN